MQDRPVQAPILFVQVFSVDFWERQRLVGSGYFVVPQESGVHKQTLSLWRPIGGIREEMQRFFLGGAPNLNDPKDSGISPEFEVRKMKR